MILKRDHNLHIQKVTEESGEDVPMDDSSRVKEECNKESDEAGPAMEGIDGEDGAQLVDNELSDKMNEFGYT